MRLSQSRFASERRRGFESMEQRLRLCASRLPDHLEWAIFHSGTNEILGKTDNVSSAVAAIALQTVHLMHLQIFLDSRVEQILYNGGHGLEVALRVRLTSENDASILWVSNPVVDQFDATIDYARQLVEGLTRGGVRRR